MKPILDSLTAEQFWTDDNVQYLRRILSEVEIVGSSAEQVRLDLEQAQRLVLALFPDESLA